MSCIHLIAPQGTDAWFSERIGAVTASMFAECRKTMKSGVNKGEYSQKAKDYAFKLAVERISGELFDDPQFDPWQAKRGRDLEPEARIAYEEKQGILVEQTGLALTEDRLFGSSVDGLVDEDGTIEVKCFLAPAKLAPILFENDIGDCVDQIQGGLWISGRKWCDFILFCPALKCINKHITVIRIHRNDEYIAELEVDILKFNQYVNQLEELLRK